MPRADDFFALSKLLIGEDSLDREVSDAYLNRIESAYPDALSSLLATYRDLAGTPILATRS
jgi:hypothetical protein